MPCGILRWAGTGGRVVAVFQKPVKLRDRFDVYVWHDGDFPFTGSNRIPTRVHHCCAQQFIRFGETVIKLMTSAHEGSV